MTPYFDDGQIQIWHADCRDVLPTLEPGSVDLVLTDPPYGMNNDCDYTRFTMGPNGHGQASSRNHAPVYGDNEPFDPAPYLDFPKVVLFGSNHFAQRLPVGTTLVWIKRFDGGFGSFLSDAEIAWMKGGHGVYCFRDTSLMAETRSRLHPTQKPVALMRWILDKWSKPNDLILDPYMGSGPIARACLDMGRRYIGIEIDQAYVEIAVKRLQQSVLPLEITA